jgi:hypothetical protein
MENQPLSLAEEYRGGKVSSTTHYENANFLRALAESLLDIFPGGTPANIDLLQRLADDELALAEHEEWARAQVAAARADTRPPLTAAQVRERLREHHQRWQNAI